MCSSHCAQLHSTCCRSGASNPWPADHIWLLAGFEWHMQYFLKPSVRKINIMFRKQMIDNDSLFDEEVLVKKHISKYSKEDSWQKVSLEQKWVQIFKKFEKDIGIPNFQKLIEFIFCLPGTSAPIERIFSMMNNIWSDHRNKMLE